MDEGEHFGFAAVGAVGDAVAPERRRRRPAALIERGDEPRLGGHLSHHRGVGHGALLGKYARSPCGGDAGECAAAWAAGQYAVRCVASPQ